MKITVLKDKDFCAQVIQEKDKLLEWARQEKERRKREKEEIR